MSSSNKSSNDADKNISHAKLCSTSPTDKTAVVQSSTISAKSKKSCFVMYSNETLSDKRNRKPKKVSTKNNLKKQTSFISKTTDDPQRTAFDANDEMAKENVIGKQSELTDQSKKPEPDAANRIVELTEIDINVSSTDSAKTKVPMLKRKREEMEATALNDAISLSVSEKSNFSSNTKAGKNVEVEKKSNDKVIIKKSLKTKEELTLKDITNLFETSNSDCGLQPIELSSENLDTKLVFNKLLTDELENSLPDPKLGITLVWENKQLEVRFFAPYAFYVQEELSDLSGVDKVFTTNPTSKHSETDSISKFSKMTPFGYYNIVQFHEKIEELFNPNQKTFQKSGKPLKFAAGDYFIRHCTAKHIKVFACALHKIISLSCVTSLLQTKAIEFGYLKTRPIIMADTDLKTVQFTNKLATSDGYYFAKDSYSLNINEDMFDRYIQLCKLITPEFYDIMGVYLVDYSLSLTQTQLQPTLTQLGEIYKKHFQKDQIRNSQLRMYLNTIHNYFLNKRINFTTGNTYNELIDVYETLIKAVKSYSDMCKMKINKQEMVNSKMIEDLQIEKYDVAISPKSCSQFAKEATNKTEVLSKKTSEKLVFLNKVVETQLNKKFDELEERLNKKDQIVKDQQEVIIKLYDRIETVNNKIEASLAQINFNENSILQLAAEFKANMVNVPVKKEHIEMIIKKLGDSEKITCKMLSVLEAVNDNLKSNNSHSKSLDKLHDNEAHLNIKDQK